MLQVVVAMVDDGAPLEDAVAAPRAHHQWPPRSFSIDPVFVESPPPYRLPRETLDGLRALGYEVVERDPLGDVQAVAIEGRVARGIADRRRTGGVARE